MSEQLNPAPLAVQCPECRQAIQYQDEVHSSYFGCPKCHTFFELTETGLGKRLRRFKDIPKMSPVLAVGSRGRLEGATYRVTGFTWRCEAKHAHYHWEEFQLRDEATGGYCQLAVYRGHWLLIRASEEQYKPGNKRTFTVNEDDYLLYNRYSPRILHAQGEFDWNVLQDESLMVSEYISPPLMLTQEKASKHATWYAARHLEPREVAAAFQLPVEQLPERQGVGAAQPVPGQASWHRLRLFTLVMALLVVVTHLWLMNTGNQALFEQEFTSSPTPPPPVVPLDSATAAANAANASDYPPSPPTGLERQPLVSPSFAVPANGALDIKLWAHVENSWVELPFTLINEQTGQQWSGVGNLEYYFGVEDGETWREGNTEQELLFSTVPAGRYHLNFYPTTEPHDPRDLTLRAQVYGKATAGSNALLALGLLLLYPGLLWWRQRHHEQTRWENSDFTPYTPSS